MTWKPPADACYGIWSTWDNRFEARGYTKEELEEELYRRVVTNRNLQIKIYKEVTEDFHINKCRFALCRKENPFLKGGCDALGCGVD